MRNESLRDALRDTRRGATKSPQIGGCGDELVFVFVLLRIDFDRDPSTFYEMVEERFAVGSAARAAEPRSPKSRLRGCA